MKIFKLTCLFIAASLVFMIGCAKDSAIENVEDMESTSVMLQTIDDGGDISEIPPIGTGPWPTFTCYSGGISIDADCDGSFELGWNHSAATYSECQCIEQYKIQQAQQNGWCWENPTPCYLDQCWKAVDNCPQ